MAKKPPKKWLMAKKCGFSMFSGYNSGIFKYFAKRIFDSSSLLKGTSFDVQHDLIRKNYLFDLFMCSSKTLRSISYH